VVLVTAVPDTTPQWTDDVVVSLNVSGAGGTAPRYQDFQWDFRRVLDSSAIYRGRNGRWQPPQYHPYWRLGPGGSGGGWEISAAERPRGWILVMRLDPAWLNRSGCRSRSGPPDPRCTFRLVRLAGSSSRGPADRRRAGPLPLDQGQPNVKPARGFPRAGRKWRSAPVGQKPSLSPALSAQL
jgi:hypothetical protein